MKRIYIVLIVAIAAIALAGPADAKGTEGAKGIGARESAPSNEFTQSRAWNKVGDNLKGAYLAALKTGFPKGERLTCYVRANENILGGDKSFLTSNGFVVQMVSGFTARGEMALKDLPQVANLPFVRSINTSSK